LEVHLITNIESAAFHITASLGHCRHEDVSQKMWPSLQGATHNLPV